MRWTDTVYQFVERNTTADRIAARVRKRETRIRNALMESGDPGGVIGRNRGDRTKRLASSIYWLGLRAWGIRRFPGSQEDYHRTVDHRQRRAQELTRDDDGDTVGASANMDWDPYLPRPPARFPENLAFDLLPHEAYYLTDRIREAHPRSLLAFLAQKGTSLAGDFPWQHPQLGEFPAAVRDGLAHAQLLAETMHGAALLYNLMLAEECPPGDARDEATKHFNERLGKWCTELQGRSTQIGNWDRQGFWNLAGELTPLKCSTRRFVDTWIDLRGWRSTSDAQTAAARALIAARELQLKGGRARLGNARALEQWGGEAGTARLSYRWDAARRILKDIHMGRVKGA